MLNRFQIRRLIQQLLEPYQQKSTQVSTWRTGDPNRVVNPDPDKLNWTNVYNPDTGEVKLLFNQHVQNIPNYPVRTGKDPDHPGLLQILGYDVAFDSNPVYPEIPPGISNVLSAFGVEPLYVDGAQFKPGLIMCNNGFILNIYSWYHAKSTGGVILIPKQTLDMTTYIPASGAQMFGIFDKDDGTIAVVSGSTEATPELITDADIPAAPDATYKFRYGVRLFSGQSAITQTATYSDLVDGRWGGGGSGGSGAPTGPAGGDLFRELS